MTTFILLILYFIGLHHKNEEIASLRLWYFLPRYVYPIEPQLSYQLWHKNNDAISLIKINNCCDGSIQIIML